MLTLLPLLPLLTLLASPAFADSITIDTGATIDADLARYEADGDCQLSVTDGELIGVIVILPCSRIVAFQRTERPKPIVYGAVLPLEVPPLEMPVSGAVTQEEPTEPAEPAMPDSIAALKADDFVTPFPVADPDYDAEAEEVDEEGGDEGAQADTLDAAPSGAVRSAPAMPPVGTKSLSF